VTFKRIASKICRYPLAMSFPVTVGSVVGMKMPFAA
jgi:hypothetical protein